MLQEWTPRCEHNLEVKIDESSAMGRTEIFSSTLPFFLRVFKLSSCHFIFVTSQISLTLAKFSRWICVDAYISL